MAITPPPRLRAAHGRAARYYRRIEQYESAARHALAEGDHTSAAKDLERLAPALLESGRHRILTALLPSIDASEVDSRPGLLLAYSRALRLLSRFDEASLAARRARRAFDQREDVPGEFDACAAEAMVYLDTVQPHQAAPLVDEAEALAVRCGGTRLLTWRSLALENLVNSGDLSAASVALDSRHPDEHPLDRAATRLSIRRGELTAALARIRPRARVTEPGRRHAPAAHREDSAMLSWVHGMLGDRIPASSIAREGCDVGRRLESPIVEGVCTGRLGLALLCGESGADASEATEHFQRALDIAAHIGVDRFRLEPLLGLTALAGVSGDVVGVREHGGEAVATARRAGDRYAAGLATVTTGVALARCGHPTAEPVLVDGLARVTATGDGYGALVTSMWLAHGALADSRLAEFQEHVRAAIEWTVALELDDLWVADPWIGLPLREDRVRLLAAAEARAIGGEYPGYLRGRLNGVRPGFVVDERAEGHAMRVTTLGGFRVTVGERTIADGEWSRKKAKELLWLLASRESRSVLRDEAIEILWPNQAAGAAFTRFRVSLHSLRNTLEPARATGEPSAFVRTQRDRVELTEHVQVDVQEFRSLTDAPPALETARRAIDLYQGDFIADDVEAEWLESVRREARQSFVEACDFAAAEHLRRGECAIAIKTARRAVALDGFRESLYRTQCEAHLAMGDRLAANRVYDDLCRVLCDELGVRPSWSLDDLESAPVTLA
jgi:DNA-binding SARP family transcriptional activator